MTPFTRWLKFNLIGALGMVVQLTLLALFTHLQPITTFLVEVVTSQRSGGNSTLALHHFTDYLSTAHRLLATAVALELTLLHNYLWHLHYTWRDRRPVTSPWHQLAKFHLANGLVSLAGNLGLTSVLLRRTHLPLLAANLIAILCCSAANFLLGHYWTFGATAARRQPAQLSSGSISTDTFSELPPPPRISPRNGLTSP